MAQYKYTIHLPKDKQIPLQATNDKAALKEAEAIMGKMTIGNLYSIHSEFVK